MDSMALSASSNASMCAVRVTWRWNGHTYVENFVGRTPFRDNVRWQDAGVRRGRCRASGDCSGMLGKEKEEF